MTDASLLHRGCYGFHATTRGCKPGALPVAVGWRCPCRLHRRCAAFARPPMTVEQAGRLPTLPGKRSAPRLEGSAGAGDRGVPEFLDGRVDELVVAGQLGLDVPGPLVGQHLDLVGLDRV